MESLLPLNKTSILVTRAKTQSSSLAAQIRAQGGEAIEFPVIQLIAPTDPILNQRIEDTLLQIEQYDWIVFTSVNGVQFFFQRLQELRIDLRSLFRARIAAVGPKTMEAVERFGLYGEELPDVFVAESLLDLLRPKLIAGERILLPRADIARKMLPDGLRELGMHVTDLTIYENHLADENADGMVELLKQRRIQMITFTSASTVRNFMLILKRFTSEPLSLIGEDVAIACIGALTAQAAQEHGLSVHCLAQEATTASMVDAMVRYVKRTP